MPFPVLHSHHVHRPKFRSHRLSHRLNRHLNRRPNRRLNHRLNRRPKRRPFPMSFDSSRLPMFVNLGSGLHLVLFCVGVCFVPLDEKQRVRRFPFLFVFKVLFSLRERTETCKRHNAFRLVSNVIFSQWCRFVQSIRGARFVA